MTDINHVVLVGRLTRNAELKTIASGQIVCKFSLAVNRSRKNGDQWVDEANFFDITLWGPQGQTLERFLTKGKLVGVDGELRQSHWQQDGQNRSKVEINANRVQLLGGNPSGSSSSDDSNNNGSWSNQGRQSESAPASGFSGDDGFADDIPF